MKVCRINAILHSGEQGKRNAPRRDKLHTELLGKYVAFDMSVVSVGQPMCLEVLFEDGTFVTTSPVVSRRYVHNANKDMYEIETDRSIYILQVETPK